MTTKERSTPPTPGHRAPLPPSTMTEHFETSCALILTACDAIMGAASGAELRTIMEDLKCLRDRCRRQVARMINDHRRDDAVLLEALLAAKPRITMLAVTLKLRADHHEPLIIRLALRCAAVTIFAKCGSETDPYLRTIVAHTWRELAADLAAVGELSAADDAMIAAARVEGVTP